MPNVLLLTCMLMTAKFITLFKCLFPQTLTYVVQNLYIFLSYTFHNPLLPNLIIYTTFSLYMIIRKLVLFFLNQITSIIYGVTITSQSFWGLSRALRKFGGNEFFRILLLSPIASKPHCALQTYLLFQASGFYAGGCIGTSGL